MIGGRTSRTSSGRFAARDLAGRGRPSYALAMAKPKRKRKKPSGGGSRPATSGPDLEGLINELEQVADHLEGAGDDPGARPMWGQVHQLLLKAKVDPHEIGRIVASKSVEGLRESIARLKGEEVEAPDEEANAAPTVEVDPEEKRKAMRAFRKRLKLVRLDHESRLGRSPLTGGKKADVDAILPPHEFPKEVWEALAAEGKLRKAGGGFYELTDDSGAGE